MSSTIASYLLHHIFRVIFRRVIIDRPSHHHRHQLRTLSRHHLLFDPADIVRNDAPRPSSTARRNKEEESTEESRRTGGRCRKWHARRSVVMVVAEEVEIDR